MATPPREDDSDHEDHGSVVTYRDDEDFGAVPAVTPLKATSASQRETLPPAPATERITAEAGKKETAGSAIFQVRAFLADICDSTPWEFTLVVLGLVFICLTIAEVSIFIGPIGSQEGLKGMSAISAAILGVMLAEVIVKTLAYDLGFWRVPRNVYESSSIIVAFPLQVAVTAFVFSQPTSFVTFQLMVASRVFRLVVCILRQRRAREFLVATRALRSLKDESLTTEQRTLQILRELKAMYPLSDVHQLQLQWCMNVIASHRLYTGVFRGPNGEPIQFSGLDEDTSKWLLNTYTQAKEDELPTPQLTGGTSKQNTPPKESDRKRSTPSPVLGPPPSEKPNSPSVSASAPNVLRAPEAKMTRGLSRRDTDGADALLSGRRHTPLYVSADKAGAMLQEVTVETVSTGAPVTNSPLLSHKRSLSRGNVLARSSEGPNLRKGSTLRRGSSFTNHAEPIVDLEEGLAFAGSSISQTRVITGASLGIVSSDVDFIFAALGDEVATGFGDRMKESVDRINREIDDWSFDVFTLNDLSGGFPLTPCLLSVLRKNNVLDALGHCVSLPVVINFCLEIERGYDRANPYHNRIHAADVVQGFHHFLTHRQFRDSITPLDRFLGLISAAIHDFRHPGVNNAFLINSRNAVAIQYNDIAVLENMHVASAFEIMRANPELDVLSGLPSAARAEARETMIQMVLATDMKAHFDVLNQFKNQVTSAQTVEKTHENLGAWWHELFPVDRDVSFSSTASSTGPLTAFPLDYRRTIMKTALHVADVSNPARPNVLTVRWADLVQEEFFRQGDQERAAGLTISMFMDRSKPSLPKMQVGFIEFIVKPLAEAFGAWLKSLRPIVEPNLAANLDYWKRRQEMETPATSGSAVSALPPPTPIPSESSKAASKFVARLKTGVASTSKHRPTGSLEEIPFATGPVETDSPLQSGLKRPLSFRRTASETFPPAGSPAGEPSKRPAVNEPAPPLLRLVPASDAQTNLTSPASNDSDTTNVTS